MKLYLSHTTAASYWESARQSASRGSVRRCLSSSAASPSSPIPIAEQLSAARRIADEYNLDLPLHTLAASSSCRRREVARRCHSIVAHSCSGLPPRGAFSLLEAGVAVCTPEACLLQMAAKAPRLDVLLAICSWCGTYSGAMRGLGALTSQARLTRFLRDCEGATGRKRLAWATEHAADGLGSPLQCRLFLALTLPRMFGGYGVPKPSVCNKGSVLAFYWPRARVSVVASPRRLGLETQQRMKQLVELQVDEDDAAFKSRQPHAPCAFTFDDELAEDPSLLDALASILNRRLGARLNYKCKDYALRKSQLLEQIGLTHVDPATRRQSVS